MTSFFDKEIIEAKKRINGVPAEMEDNLIRPKLKFRPKTIGGSSIFRDSNYTSEGNFIEVFNRNNLFVDTNMSDESTDSEVGEITNQPELTEGFGRFSKPSNLDDLSDITKEDLVPKPLRARQINEGKWHLPLKMLKHFKLQYIHVQTKWLWVTKERYKKKDSVDGAWVYAIFKLYDDVLDRMEPKKVIILVPKRYAARAYELNTEGFDYDRELNHFLLCPQWWREITDFEDNSRLV
ncbi:MAG: hypothetical protein CXT73_04770 [Methanobacteriota archaeon]|nr:MAG: hypothetical protein CXT73_04770 [Euryarchaeota archaeon]